MKSSRSFANVPNYQKGMTPLGWLLVISLIGFFALLTMIMLPIYMGNMEVRSALQAIAVDPEVYEWKKSDIRGSFSRRLIVGSWSRNVNAKDLKVKDNKDGTRTMQIQYQTKEHFSGNIFIVVEFDETVDIPREK